MPDTYVGHPVQPVGQYEPLHISVATSSGAANAVPVGIGVNTTIAATITAGIAGESTQGVR